MLFTHDVASGVALHGLRIEETFGDYELNPYLPHGSPRLILVARKGYFTEAVSKQRFRPEELNRGMYFERDRSMSPALDCRQRQRHRLFR